MYNLQKSRENIDKFLPVYMNNPTILIHNYNGPLPPSSDISGITTDNDVSEENISQEDFDNFIEESDSDEDSVESSIETPLQSNNVYFYENNYYYIKNEKYLQKDFEAATIPSDYNMEMCIYKCVRQGCTPFLMYLLQYHPTENMYVLPSRGGEAAIESVEPSPQSEETPDNTLEEETAIMEEYNQYLFDIFPPSEFRPLEHGNYPEEEPTDLYDPEIFKGFYNHKSSKKLTMVMDATRINLPVTTSKKYVWASPYEIFISKTIKEVPIHDSVSESFIQISDNEKDFHHLYVNSDENEEGVLVKTPFILYLCKDANASAKSSIFSLGSFIKTSTESDDEPSIVNDYAETTEQSNISPDTQDAANISDSQTGIATAQANLLYPRISHPLIGNYTFFSNKMLNAEGESDRLRRFAVFVDIPGLRPLYVESEEYDKLHHLYDVDQTEQYSAITYLRPSDNAQLWCIKSPEYFSEIPTLL